MQKILKIMGWCISSITICLPIATTSIKPDVNTKPNMKGLCDENEYLKTANVVTECEQITTCQSDYYHWGIDWSPHLHTIKISNTIKKVYLSSDSQNIDTMKMMQNCHQITPTTSGQNFGIQKVANYCYDETNKDLDDRIQDWTSPYLNNLKCNLSLVRGHFGLAPLIFSLNDVNCLPINNKFADFHSECTFSDENGSPIIFPSIKDINLGVNASINSRIYADAMPAIFLKENFSPTAKNKDFDIFQLRGEGLSPHDNIIDLKYVNYEMPMAATYDLNNVISITGGSYNNKAIRLGINRKFIENAQKLNEFHLEKHKIWYNDWKELNSKHHSFTNEIFNNLIDMNVIDDSWIKRFEGKIDPWLPMVFLGPSCYFNTLIHSKDCNIYTDETKVATSLGFNKFDNPLPVFHDLCKEGKLTLNYEIANPKEPNKWMGESKTVNLSDLVNGVSLLLNSNQDGDFKFKFDSITLNEINTPDMYIGEQNVTKITNDSTIIKSSSDGIYTLDKPKITDINLATNDIKFNSNYFTNEINDNLLLKQYVQLVTSYGEISEENILNKNDYKIIRNNKIGQIKIIINFNGHEYTQTYHGFKKQEINIQDIDANVLVNNNLIADDLTDQNIKNLMKLNNLDSYAIDQLEFEINNRDDINGTANVSIVKCNDLDLNDEYLHKSFKIFNLKPYYIRPIAKINSDILERSPNDISLEQFKRYFIETSDEFMRRTGETLNINLIPSKNKLCAQIKYKDTNSQSWVSLDYEFNFDVKAKNNLILWICLGVLGIILIIGILFLARRRFKRNI